MTNIIIEAQTETHIKGTYFGQPFHINRETEQDELDTLLDIEIEEVMATLQPKEKPIICDTLQLSEPAVVFHKQTGQILKIGEREEITTFYQTALYTYVLSGYAEKEDDFAYMDLPNDPDIVNRVYQEDGYIQELYAQTHTDQKA